jgi:acetyl/propionyl-CoA carboxylase alpha subunit
VESAKGIMAQLERAQREARAAFGDDAVLLDPVLDGPKAQ